jgi:FtsP/CotA-like multicopper oxidase with cupredoxin domain
LPAQLVNFQRPDPGRAAMTRAFRLSNREINGLRMDLTRIDLAVEANTSEIWEVEGAGPHSFHIHLVRFLILDIDGEPPPPLLSGWKDTVQLKSGARYRLLANFAGYTDTTSPYMFHCHVLDHEDAGMMGQFIVVAPGQAVPDRLPDPHR